MNVASTALSPFGFGGGMYGGGLGMYPGMYGGMLGGGMGMMGMGMMGMGGLMGMGGMGTLIPLFDSPVIPGLHHLFAQAWYQAVSHLRSIRTCSPRR